MQAGPDAFLEMLRPDACILAYWQANMISVLYKKGGPKDVADYRPITLLPNLYKLFIKVLHSRVSTKLLEAQSVEQTGLRTGYPCYDLFFVLTLLAELHAEHRRPL